MNIKQYNMPILEENISYLKTIFPNIEKYSLLKDFKITNLTFPEDYIDNYLEFV